MVLIVLGTPIGGLCLVAYISPILVRAFVGETNVVLGVIMWLALGGGSAIYIYKPYLLPVTLRLGEQLFAWHRDLSMQAGTPRHARTSAEVGGWLPRPDNDNRLANDRGSYGPAVGSLPAAAHADIARPDL